MSEAATGAVGAGNRPELSLDFETRSTADLKRTGAHKYAADPTTDILCMAYAFPGEEPAIWRRGEEPSEVVVAHVLAGGVIRAWNAQFERLLWRHVLTPRYGFPEPALEQFVCTAAEAGAMALPRSLGEAASALKIEMQKDVEGHRLMLQMCRPRSTKGGSIVWWEDVRTEMAVGRLLRRLSPHEREVYLLDQRINDRGVRLDKRLALAAKAVAEDGLAHAAEKVCTATEGKVSKVTQVGRLREWLERQGLYVPDLTKTTVDQLLEESFLPAPVQAALMARSEAGKASVSKIEAMLKVAMGDQHMRGLLLYHGANTGRWAGRLVQPQNFPRGTIPGVERYLDLIYERDYATLDLFHPPIAVVSAALRSMLIADPGHELAAGDFSAIEARVVNWLAGEHRVLDDFRAYDAGDKTRDPYVRNAMRLYRIAYEQVNKFPERQTGKFQELGCGFGMGFEKAMEAARDIYGLSLTEEEAKRAVEGYRESHPNVVQLWADVNEAAMAAVENPGAPFTVDKGEAKLTFFRKGAFLWMKLPSGRLLCYPFPRIVMRETPWSTPEKPVVRPAVQSWHVNAKTRQWSPRALYGGLLVENATQAVARDIMVAGMFRAEERGAPVIMSVHDEVVSQVPEGYISAPEYSAILTTLPKWAGTIPVAAESWVGHRYRK